MQKGNVLVGLSVCDTDLASAVRKSVSRRVIRMSRVQPPRSEHAE